MRRDTLKAIIESPWALLPSTLSRIVDSIRQAATSEPGDGTKLVALDGPHGGATRVGLVSVLPVYGVIEHHSDWMMEYFGGCSIDGLREALQAELADPSVKAIVLDIDSPGGTVAGMTEIAAELRSLRGGEKPIVAVANTLAASAAYWLASQADECSVSPSGQVGSIGVYAVHQDMSRYLDEMGITTTIVSAGPHKTEGNPFEPLTDEALADLQARVDASYAQFLADVAAGRRVTASQVEADYGGGRVLTAKNALAAGMVDRIETLSQTVARLDRTASRGRRTMGAEDLAPELEATADDQIDAGHEPPPVDGQPPFSERIAALAAEATELVDHASERARLRAKEGRPAFSTTTERSLRAIREAVDDLLEPADPEPSDAIEPAVDPPPVAPVTPPAAATQPVKRMSREAFLRHLEEANTR